MVSVIIAAHNEEAVIGRCLEALTRQGVPELEVIVSANGCRDRTAPLAAAHGAIVVDRSEAGKAAALNAAELVATSFPRVYLDADIVLPDGALARIVAALASSPRALAAVPRRRVETAGRPWAVRAYTAINERLPVFREGLFGRGAIVLLAPARARFDAFPTLIADDLFLDSLFAADEKLEVASVEVIVDAPHSTRDLLARLVRVRRGNRELRTAADAGAVPVTVRASDRWAWLRDVVVPHPRLIFAAVPYVVITLIAARRARRARAVSWGQDTSTRRAATSEGGRA